MDSELQGYRTGDAGKVGFRIGGIQDRWDAGQEGFITEEMLDRRDTGKGERSTPLPHPQTLHHFHFFFAIFLCVIFFFCIIDTAAQFC